MGLSVTDECEDLVNNIMAGIVFFMEWSEDALYEEYDRIESHIRYLVYKFFRVIKID